MKIKVSLLLCIALTGVSCGRNLNSLDGPSSGTVSGLVCSDLPSLTAVNEFPTIRDTFINDGKCLRLRRQSGVKVIRTVMMPGDGKYSQFEAIVSGNTKKLWIKTSSIRNAS